MAKSNMRSAGIRRHHRRIYHQAQIDKREEEQRNYTQKLHVPTVKEKVTVSIADICEKFLKKFHSVIHSFFGGGSQINLDLTTGHGRNAIFGTNRDSGAHWLRSVWSGLGTMVSTRDGKIIR